MCGFDRHLLAARLVPLPRHGNFTKKITYTSDFFIIIRYLLLSTQSMISRLYLGKYKAKAKEVGLLRKGKYKKGQNSLVAHWDAFMIITRERLQQAAGRKPC